MFAWLYENLATIVISAVLAGVVALILVRMVRNRKNGNSSCGCGCGGCPMDGSCHHGKER